MTSPVSSTLITSQAIPLQNAANVEPKTVIEEQRRGQRQEVILPLRITVLDGRTVNWFAQTRNIGAGGVRFVAKYQLQVGKAVEYVVTLSSYEPVVAIRCVGKILRCVKKYGDDSYDVAATMDRYVFDRQKEMERFQHPAEQFPQALESTYARMPTRASGRCGDEMRDRLWEP